MLPEQLWDADDLPGKRMKRGGPTGSAMPLCWAHAEYVSLVRSAHDRVPFDRIEPAFQRYVVNHPKNRHQIWSAHHPIRHMPAGQILRLILAVEAIITWSVDGWASTTKSDTTHLNPLNVWFADLPTGKCLAGSVIEFTFFWTQAARWEGKNYSVAICKPDSASGL
jgi:glucoamylase